MKYLLVVLYFISFASIAFCGDRTLQLIPFAKEVERREDWRAYEVFFPISENNESKTMYLSSLSVTVPNTFEVELNARINEENNSYYSAFFRIDKKLVDSVEVVGGYNATNKERTGFAFCGNFKSFNLPELISNGVNTYNK
ncbi:hypothetical protein tinsulaeT_00290 [Thalassotalea insulae]|uniref:Uncharacterized protein n=1 Tax=Thalassotalea insulae TaxID=2056778 RepID=A0ABQ6GND1_9GAMM|nr:hypothetical protein [Thalassotalea insulae]GLX76689.1 hypothetical protein tinsulaeT_00290 [Thalassotalea insulae]